MKKYSITAILTISFALVFSIANVIADQSAKIAELENQYFTAIEKQDQKMMDSLLADNFEISSMTTGWSMNKEDFLKTIPKQVIKWQEITDVEVTMDGDKANSKVDISMTKTFEGKDHSGDYEVYSVWVNNGGNWQLIERKIKFLKP